jgi:transitional endoplasmic reticulum ATPase
MSDIPYDIEPIENVAIGRLAKIVSISDDGLIIHARLENGMVTRFTTTEPTVFKAEDVVILTDDHVERTSDDAWADNLLVGVVRKIFQDEMLVESNHTLRLIPFSEEDAKMQEGYTISYSESGKVRSIISKTPITLQPFGLDSEDSAEQYRVDVSKLESTFDDFGGYKDVVARAHELIETQLDQRNLLKAIGVRPVKGVLFSGYPGTGKTLLAQIIAHEAKASFYNVSGPSIVSKWLGSSEGVLRGIFEDAAKKDKAIIFFDEIDSIAEHRKDDSHEASKRLVAQLLTLLDGFDRSGGNVVVIAATNRRQDIDTALLRPGRFDWEIEFALPLFEDRVDILRVHMKTLQTVGSFPLKEIARLTEGWTPAELSSLWTEAGLVTAGDKRLAICDEDFVEGFERVSLRSKRLHKNHGED